MYVHCASHRDWNAVQNYKNIIISRRIHQSREGLVCVLLYSDALHQFLLHLYVLSLNPPLRYWLTIRSLGLIAGRIWWVNKLSGSTRSLVPVIVVVVESGALYSVFLITLVTTYVSGSWFYIAVMDAVSPPPPPSRDI